MKGGRPKQGGSGEEVGDGGYGHMHVTFFFVGVEPNTDKYETNNCKQMFFFSISSFLRKAL